ncbi:hypothetical protein [Nostoc commune]|uniref:hypothetical protein n=1 Tax=Nostoc commune TaxID=1178 RepID=UPI0018C79848|nr:hypothetical protein [Nostoc commune]MBG1263670.1 hypothetical protein [Nostoc commune BAE]
MGIYLLAMFAGVVSNVPGGLGVFETIILLIISSSMLRTVVFALILNPSPILGYRVHTTHRITRNPWKTSPCQERTSLSLLRRGTGFA